MLLLHFACGVFAAAYWVLRVRRAGWSGLGQIGVGLVSWVCGMFSFVVALVDWLVND